MNFFQDISPKFVIPLAAIIIAIVLISFGRSGNPINPVVVPNPQIAATDETRIGILEKELEKKLMSNLQQMSGVGNVQVSVTLSSSLKSDFATSGSVTKKTMKEADKSGGVRESTEVTENSQLVLPNGASKPVIVMEERPAVAGVLIISEGASDPKVRENIHTAVRTLLDIPANKINVQPMGGKS